jgi:type II secretory pathway pseudopilin PulG
MKFREDMTRISITESHNTNESGIAVIIALVMILIMSTLAITISFMSNIDFQTMSNYKQGQEAFLAAEKCVQQAKRVFETTGVETLFYQLQVGAERLGIEVPPTPSKSESYCRTGSRNFHRDNAGDPPAPIIHLPPPPTKQMGRPLKHVSLPSGGVGGATAVPASFLVTGKGAGDRDKKDTNPDINTGVEIAVGFETFVPGGATNVYSGQ